MEFIDNFWHKKLKRPYKLAVALDKGSGPNVVLLHGLAAKGGDWQRAMGGLDGLNARFIAFDLLGFGSSSKPDWSSYDIDEHAKSVVFSIKKTATTPVILVGHSMGAVIATRVASKYPKLVKHLILYELPVYINHNSLKKYQPINKAYTSLLSVVANNPSWTIRMVQVLGKIASDLAIIVLNENNWLPFEKSLRNTVMSDSVYADLQTLSIPVDIVYGKYDFVVIQGVVKKLFKKTGNISFHQVKETHRITQKTGKIIKELISK